MHPSSSGDPLSPGLGYLSRVGSGFLMIRRRGIGGNENGEEEKSEIWICISSGDELGRVVRRLPLKILEWLCLLCARWKRVLGKRGGGF